MGFEEKGDGYLGDVGGCVGEKFAFAKGSSAGMDTNWSLGEGKEEEEKVGMKKVVEVRSATRSAHALRRTDSGKKGLPVPSRRAG